MQTSDFDFTLPETSIALRPAQPRDAARLMHVSPVRRGADGAFAEPLVADHVVRELPSLCRSGDVLVLNDSRVLPVAFNAVRPARTNAEDVAVKLNLIERLNDNQWLGFAKPGRRLRPGDILHFLLGTAADDLRAEILTKHEDGSLVLQFNVGGEALDAAFHRCGLPPLPPYIADRRAPDAQDATDYQTTFAAADDGLGSVAAPTAGLHFTSGLMQALREVGVEIVTVRLHVGAGTFLPVKADILHDHVMHEEHFDISPSAASIINAAKRDGRRVMAVGTTALRALESAARQDGDGAWMVQPGKASTRIFITPGYQFKIVQRLLTNFHLPKSTLFMLVSAFSGLSSMQFAYRRAIDAGYRFYSYGDACLLEPEHG